MVKIWHWFEFLYISALIMLIFGFLWKWIVVIPIALFSGAVGITSLKPMNIVNAIGYYFLAAFIAFSALGITSTLPFGYSLFIAFLGALILFLQGVLNVSNIEKDARLAGDYENLNNLSYSLFSVLFGVFMYVLILFIPQIGINLLTIWFLDTIEFILNIKYLGWIIGAIAMLNVFNIIFMGFTSLIGLLALLKEYITHSENEVELSKASNHSHQKKVGGD